MDFKKMKWIDVPDPNNMPTIDDIPDRPEYQDVVPAFDADNMNRIEEGILEAHNSIKGLNDNKLDVSAMEKYAPVDETGGPNFMKVLAYNEGVFSGTFLGRFGKSAYWYKDGYVYEFDFANKSYSKFSEFLFSGVYDYSTVNTVNPQSYIPVYSISKLDDNTLVYANTHFSSYLDDSNRRRYKHDIYVYILKRNSTVPSFVGKVNIARNELEDQSSYFPTHAMVYKDGYFYFEIYDNYNSSYALLKVSYNNVASNTYTDGVSCPHKLFIGSGGSLSSIINGNVIIANKRIVDGEDEAFTVETVSINNIYDYDETSNLCLVANYSNNGSYEFIYDYNSAIPALVYFKGADSYKRGFVFIIDKYLFRVIDGWMFKTRLI